MTVSQKDLAAKQDGFTRPAETTVGRRTRTLKAIFEMGGFFVA